MAFIDRTASEMTGNRMKERGVTCSIWTPGRDGCRCSEDKASVHRIITLPTIANWSGGGGAVCISCVLDQQVKFINYPHLNVTS